MYNYEYCRISKCLVQPQRKLNIIHKVLLAVCFRLQEILLVYVVLWQRRAVTALPYKGVKRDLCL